MYFTLYTQYLEMSAYMLWGKEEYDELALSEVIFVKTSAVKDEYLENTEKDRMKRLIRLKPPLSSK
ncbi:hypothetical protein HKD37_13G038713 [Glycine soja]